MNYPYFLLSNSVRVESLLGEGDFGEPLVFDFSGSNPDLWQMEVTDQEGFQAYVDRGLSDSGRQWGVSGYLEKRDSLLRDLPQMVSEERFFHLGLDVILPRGASLYVPLDGEVVETGYEEGKGNFGGFILIRHELSGEVFYSLWGHLRSATLPSVGTVLRVGERFAELGEFSENGDWFYHTHLQVLTERGYADGFIGKGYCTAEKLAEIYQFCPSPLFLLRY